MIYFYSLAALFGFVVATQILFWFKQKNWSLWLKDTALMTFLGFHAWVFYQATDGTMQMMIQMYTQILMLGRGI